MNPTSTDRIERSILLRAPRSRIWRALTDADEFGTWFRVDLDRPFAVGATIRGKITYPGYEHLALELVVEQMEPERYFSFRWLPDEVDLERDGSDRSTTLVEFRLEGTAEGIRLTVAESGFDRLPRGRREEVFRENSKGWEMQVENIRSHVSG